MFISCVSANILIDQSAQQNPTFIGEQKIFYLTLTNNNSFPIYNITLSPVNLFNFPVIGGLAVGESKTVPYTVLNNQLMSPSQVFVSTISYFFDTTYNVTSKAYSETISDTGFSICNLTLMQNDSISWLNSRSVNSEVKSLSSGWSNILLTPLGFQSKVYPDVGSWVFYVDGLQACTLNVIPYNNIVSAHDSLQDIPVSFTLSTVVNPSNLQLNILQNNFTSNNNLTQVSVFNVKNNGNYPLYNVKFSDDLGWMNFSSQDFTMDSQTNQNIFVNITPLIHFTNESNMTHIITIHATSSNGGNVTGLMYMFVNYVNLDNSSSNNIYNVNFLSLNATAQACHDNRIGLGSYKAGFEQCALLEVVNNQTVFRDIPALATLSETDIKSMIASFNGANTLVQNNINSQGITQDYMNNVSSKYDSSIIYMMAIYHTQQLWMDFSDMNLRDTRKMVVIFWVTLGSIILLRIIFQILYLTWKFKFALATLQYRD